MGLIKRRRMLMAAAATATAKKYLWVVTGGQINLPTKSSIPLEDLQIFFTPGNLYTDVTPSPDNINPITKLLTMDVAVTSNNLAKLEQRKIYSSSSNVTVTYTDDGAVINSSGQSAYISYKFTGLLVGEIYSLSFYGSSVSNNGDTCEVFMDQNEIGPTSPRDTIGSTSVQRNIEFTAETGDLYLLFHTTNTATSATTTISEFQLRHVYSFGYGIPEYEQYGTTYTVDFSQDSRYDDLYGGSISLVNGTILQDWDVVTIDSVDTYINNFAVVYLDIPEEYGGFEGDTICNMATHNFALDYSNPQNAFKDDAYVITKVYDENTGKNRDAIVFTFADAESVEDYNTILSQNNGVSMEVAYKYLNPQPFSPGWSSNVINTLAGDNVIYVSTENNVDLSPDGRIDYIMVQYWNNSEQPTSINV